MESCTYLVCCISIQHKQFIQTWVLVFLVPEGPFFTLDHNYKVKADEWTLKANRKSIQKKKKKKSGTGRVGSGRVSIESGWIPVDGAERNPNHTAQLPSLIICFLALLLSLSLLLSCSSIPSLCCCGQA